jgi:hypothetical protein
VSSPIPERQRHRKVRELSISRRRNELRRERKRALLRRWLRSGTTKRGTTSEQGGTNDEGARDRRGTRDEGARDRRGTNKEGRGTRGLSFPRSSSLLVRYSSLRPLGCRRRAGAFFDRMNRMDRMRGGAGGRAAVRRADPVHPVHPVKRQRAGGALPGGRGAGGRARLLPSRGARTKRGPKGRDE